MFSTVIKKPEFVLYIFVMMKKESSSLYMSYYMENMFIKQSSYCICTTIKPSGIAFL